jgi:hypothetical protein
VTVTPEGFWRVAEESHRALLPLADLDWTVPGVGEWSCWQTAEHLADSYFHHATRIVAELPIWFVPAAIRVDDGTEPVGLLEVVDACARLLRSAGTGADPGTRAFHPWGASDPEGSLAMGAAEGLVHTWDLTSALDRPWRPPAALCDLVLARLFPDAPQGDPSDVLLWCTGRTALPDRPRQETWRWWSAVRP